MSKRGERVRITFPDGRTRAGWHEAWRALVVWKELEPTTDDSDPASEPKDWFWAHAHESEVEFAPLFRAS